jgi:hypothetical protein
LTGEEKPREERKVSFGSTLFTSGLVILAAVAIFFVVNGFRGTSGSSEFEGLVSPSDGKIIVPRDGDLRIESISFRDYDANEVPVNFSDNPAHKINSIFLREVSGVQEFDLRRTLLADSIDISTLPAVPQEITITVSDNQDRGKVGLYVITDRPYETTFVPGGAVKSSQLTFRGQIGRKGLRGYVAVDKNGIYLRPVSDGIPIGEGPVAILVAVRKVAGRPVGRSQLVTVKRKGIIHPDDQWLDEFNTGYFSRPFMSDSFETSRAAFYSPISGGPRKLLVSTLDFTHRFDIGSLFPEGGVSIDHWGKNDNDFDVLYVRVDSRPGELFMVKVGQSEIMRLIDSPAQAAEGAEPVPDKPTEDREP